MKTTPHDLLFKRTFSEKEAVKAYLRKFVSKDLLKGLDLRTLKLENNSFVSPHLEERISDVVYSCKWKGKEEVVLTFLWEHKSYVPDFPHLQLMRYLLDGYDNQVANLEKGQPKKLNVIIPIILYHGIPEWNYRPFSDFFNIPKDFTLPFIPTFDYHLTDLKNYSREEILAIKFGFLVSTLLLFKHKSNQEYVLQNPQEVFIFVNEKMDIDLKDDFLTAIIEYILQAFKIKKEVMKAAIEKLPEVEDNFVSTWDMLKAEGRVEGRVEGEQVVALKVRINWILKTLIKFPKFSDEMIADFTEAEIELVQFLKKKVWNKPVASANKALLTLFKGYPELLKNDKEDLKLLAKKYGQEKTKK